MFLHQRWIVVLNFVGVRTSIDDFSGNNSLEVRRVLRQLNLVRGAFHSLLHLVEFFSQSILVDLFQVYFSVLDSQLVLVVDVVECKQVQIIASVESEVKLVEMRANKAVEYLDLDHVNVNYLFDVLQVNNPDDSVFVHHDVV